MPFVTMHLLSNTASSIFDSDPKHYRLYKFENYNPVQALYQSPLLLTILHQFQGASYRD